LADSSDHPWSPVDEDVWTTPSSQETLVRANRRKWLFIREL
jgi:hypothetical protein